VGGLKEIMHTLLKYMSVSRFLKRQLELGNKRVQGWKFPIALLYMVGNRNVRLSMSIYTGTFSRKRMFRLGTA
jgi:hypothetical protein